MTQFIGYLVNFFGYISTALNDSIGIIVNSDIRIFNMTLWQWIIALLGLGLIPIIANTILGGDEE